MQRSYIKIKNINQIENVNSILNQHFEDNIEITWHENIGEMTIFDVTSFHYELKKIYQLLSSDLGICICFLIVPKFDCLFLKYLLQIENDVHTAFELFINNPNHKEVVNDAKLLLQNINHSYLVTASVYVKCNLNSSEAAKALYLHRNSFSYRLNKFIYQSDIDIKEFENALFFGLLCSLLHI